ncbi:MAG TPA: hypothetical protein DDY31_06390 [Lachnospiraceae bacterium]|nr:hypothetical protein [Lachnospiraceae bacterium]
MMQQTDERIRVDMQIEVMNRFMFENIEKLIGAGKLDEKRIVLFGLNTSSFAAKDFLEKRGLEIYAYIDNDERKRNEVNSLLNEVLPHQIAKRNYEQLKEKMVFAFSPEELLGGFDKDAVVLIASKYYSQMCRQLQSMGYEEGEQIYQTMDFYGMEKIFGNPATLDCGAEMSADEVKICQMDILRYIKKVCLENGLRYYLCAGTLLGAVRHKGYIPWDDDIDITMPYPDYRKMLEIIQKENGRYQVWSPYNYQEKCFCFFSRVFNRDTIMRMWEYPFLITGGVSIDIFPLFGLPDNLEEIMPYYTKVRRLQEQFISTYIEYADETEDTVQRRIRLQNELLSLLEQYDFDESGQAFSITKYKEREILPTAIYQNSVEVEFEGELFAAAAGYDRYLKALYGNYMKLPPEEQRATDHNFKAFWRKVKLPGEVFAVRGA